MGLKSLLLKTVLFVGLFSAFPYVYGNSIRELISKKECEKISGVEVRYNEFYELYLGHDKEKDEIQEYGFIYMSLSKAVNACCPGMDLNFTLVNRSAEFLVQEDILNHHDGQNSSLLVFYFPEFTAQGDQGNLGKIMIKVLLSFDHCLYFIRIVLHLHD